MNFIPPQYSVITRKENQATCSRRLPCAVGFTLVELLAVLAILGILASMLAPTVASTRPNTAGFQCANNLRQLALAWKMYAEDNRGKLVFNADGADSGLTLSTPSWVAGWLTLDADGLNRTDNTNVDMLINHTRYPYAAYLGPYIKTASVFKCPADKALVTIAGQRMPRVRSVSMNSFVGQNARSWTGASRFSLYKNTVEIQSPSRLFVFLDEREDSLNDGCFQSNPDTPYNLIDYPASYHNSAGAFGFADGHTEIHRWQDPRTMPPLRPGLPLPLNVILPGDVDVDWLQQHTSSPGRGF